ncbi:MAG: YabP/YqfC family sporulation protein [Clostridia bacterium]|nr:YabP/YqfC family sporulation protein [Clostridia bacterium]
MSIRIRRKRAEKLADREHRARMMRQRRPVMDALELPADVSGGSVRVILIGGRRALIENHLGVADVGQESISLTTRGGLMTVHGQNLLLTDVREGALSVEGQIESLILPHWREGADGRD